MTVTGRVRTLFEGTWEDPRPTHGGYRHYNAGRTAVLVTTDDHTLVLHSGRMGNTSIGEMYVVGVFPEEYQVVVAKGVHSPRAAYEPIAAEVVMVAMTRWDGPFRRCTGRSAVKRATRNRT